MPPQGGTTGSLVQAGVRTSQSADLQIVTADGDKVTISSDRTTSVGYAGFSATSGNTRVQGQALQVSSESSVSMSVEGTLDADELADIKKVVKLLERAASSHDATKLLKRLSHAHLDTLSSVEGSVERTVEYNVVQASGSLPAATDATPRADASTPPTPLPQEQAEAQAPASVQPKAEAVPAESAPQAGDFLFAILASMLRSPTQSRAA
jgi:hypothetical protein